MSIWGCVRGGLWGAGLRSERGDGWSEAMAGARRKGSCRLRRSGRGRPEGWGAGHFGWGGRQHPRRGASISQDGTPVVQHRAGGDEVLPTANGLEGCNAPLVSPLGSAKTSRITVGLSGSRQPRSDQLRSRKLESQAESARQRAPHRERQVSRQDKHKP